MMKTAAFAEPPMIATTKLILRAPVADDAPELASLASDPAVAALAPDLPCPCSIKDARAIIDRSNTRTGNGNAYAITLAHTGNFVGMCSVRARSAALPHELSYWIGRKWWGQGFATDAARASVDLAFKVTGINEIFASTQPDNPPARAVLTKLGFVYAGLDEMTPIAGTPRPVERYRLTREHWLETLLASDAAKLAG